MTFIDALCNQLHNTGSAVVEVNGKKLALVMSGVLSFSDGTAPAGPAILVAWEGQGAFFWDISKPLSNFKLMEAGFSLIVTPTLGDILRRVGEVLKDFPAGDVGGSATPLLEGPQGQV